MKAVTAGAAGLGFLGISREVIGQDKPRLIRVAAGSPGTSYYTFSGPMGNLINTHSRNPRIATTVSTSGGGLANVRLLEAGETDIACTQANTAWAAYNVGEPFKKKVDIRAVLAAEATPVYFVVRANSKYQTVKDLLGAKLTPGDQAGGTHVLFRDIMKTLGYSYSESNLAYMPFGECKDALADGKVDVWWAFQSANVTALAAMTNIRIIGFSAEELKKIAEDRPYLTPATVSAGAYGNNIPSVPVPTTAVTSLWICRPDMDASLVYEMVKVICEHKDVVRKSQASSQMFDAKFAAGTRAIPYHEGATRYYKEVGAL